MLKIGFADYYISEWHANNYPAWFSAAAKNLGIDSKIAYAWAEMDISPVDGRSTDAWCKEFHVERCNTLDELCEKSDVLVVLAPSNPEKHLGYAQTVLTYGKPTYIDKTFAPDLATAQEIFRIAEQYHTPLFSTSALRYADELRECNDVQTMVVTGGGSNFEEYSVHTIEIIESVMKGKAASVRSEKLGIQRLCRIRMTDGREAAIVYAPPLGFSVTVEMKDGTVRHQEITSEFFLSLITDILRFFVTKKVPFDRNETLEVMRIREALLDVSRDGEWITLA